MRIIKALTVCFLFLACEKRQDSPTPSTSAQIPAVAHLVLAESSVSYRRAQALEWNAAAVGLSFFNLDSVKTAAGSQASVEFNNKSYLKVKENSLVIILERKILPEKDQSTVSLKSGKAHAELLPDTTKTNEILIKSKTAWIRASKKPNETVKTVVIMDLKDNGDLEVKSETGKIELVSQEKTYDLNDGESATVAAPVEKPSEQPLPNEPAAETPPQHIEFKKTPPSIETAATKPAPVAKTPPAVYFFRVIKIEQKGQGKSRVAELAAECDRGYQAYYKNKIVSNSQGQIKVILPLAKGINVVSLQMINEKQKDVRYENLEIENNE